MGNSAHDVLSQLHPEADVCLSPETLSALCVRLREYVPMCPLTMYAFHCGRMSFAWALFIYLFLLRTTWANRSSGNHKWECNGAERDPERVYWRKESKGEDAMERTSVSWELFLISQDESRALSPENRHSGPFSKKKKKKNPIHPHPNLFSSRSFSPFTLSTPSISVQFIPYSSTFPSLFAP